MARKRSLEKLLAVYADAAVDVGLAIRRTRGIVPARAKLEAATKGIIDHIEGTRSDAFYGGYCCALSAALYMEDGSDANYVEAVDACGIDELLAWAKKNNDLELPRLRKARAFLRERDAMKRRRKATS